jgi:hypothetical protein
VSDNALLREITLEIMNHQRPLYSLGAETGALRRLLEARAGYRIDPQLDIARGETLTAAGLAISPTQAAMCASEHARTAAFIRGLEQAIREASGRIHGRPIRILYAGCGPYALLAIPLMSLFPAEKVRFTLLDIHKQSIESAKTVVEALGFSEYVSNYSQEDACTYRVPADTAPDIVLSETMNACLAKEPLVTIACRLLSQADKAVMLPSSVRIDACLMDKGKEFEPGKRAWACL